jgi:hypothetical protein
MLFLFLLVDPSLEFYARNLGDLPSMRSVDNL